MDLITTIENLLNQDQNKRLESEKAITELLEYNFEDYLEKMCQVLTGETLSLRVRKLSTTLIKNPIVSSKYNPLWMNLKSEVKDKVKNYVLSVLGSETPEIRKGASSMISSIAKIEVPLSEKWPGLITILCQNKFTNSDLHFAAIDTLGYLCEDIPKKNFSSNEIDQILSAIVLCIKENISNTNLAYVALKALVRAIPLIGVQKMNIRQYSDLLLEEIFNLGNTYQANETILEEICKAFIEIADNYYDIVELYMDKIFRFTYLLISNNNERLKILGFEFWFKLGNEELERVKSKGRQICKYYFQSQFETLIDIIDKNIVSKLADETEDEWTSSKASRNILVILTQVVNQNSYEQIITTIKSKFYNIIKIDFIQSDDINTLRRVLLLLTYSLESIHKSSAFQIALSSYLKVLNILQYKTNIEVQIAASRALVMICKVLGKYLESHNLKVLIPIFKNLIFSHNKVGINMCEALNFTIMALGDAGTNKTQSK